MFSGILMERKTGDEPLTEGCYTQLKEKHRGCHSLQSPMGFVWARLRAEVGEIYRWLQSSWSGLHCWEFFLSEPQFCPLLTGSSHLFHERYQNTNYMNLWPNLYSPSSDFHFIGPTHGKPKRCILKLIWINQFNDGLFFWHSLDPWHW